MTLSRLSSNRVAPYNISTIGWDVLTVTPVGPNVALSWPAMPNAVNYFVQVSGLAPVSVGNVTSYTYTGLTIGQSYSFSVIGVDSSGSFSGSASAKTATPPGWNAASGGTEATISNYLSTGQTWKTHTFTSSGTLNITNAGLTFSVLLVGGGGYGSGNTGAAGGGGEVVENTSMTLTTGSKTITVGGSDQNTVALGLTARCGTGGGGAFARGGSSYYGATTYIGGLGYDTGSGLIGGGGAGNGGSSPSNTTELPGPGRASSVSGTSYTYSPGGTGRKTGAGPTQTIIGGGGNGGGGSGQPGSAGAAGIVIVAYRIG